MRSNSELVKLFFHDLKQYNSSNFKSISSADLSTPGPEIYKAFSSVITRYFIFKEKHPEISEGEHNLLYFKLKLDLIARYFMEYPDTSTDNLVAFQLELNNYADELRRNLMKEDIEDESN